MEEKRTPAIRFHGFDGPWQQFKLDEVVLPYSDPIPTPNDGYVRLGLRSHAKGTFYSLVRPGMELETARMYRVGANNLIVNITFAWEHAVAITSEKDSGKLVSHRFPQFSFREGMVSGFFRFRILDEKFRYHLWLSSPGGAGRNRVLKTNEMLQYLLWVPRAKEQLKIALYLEELDKLITRKQLIHEKLQNLKSAMLEKMFPKDGADAPEVRFKGFTNSWRKYSLRMIAEFNPKAELPDLFEYVDLESIKGAEMISHRQERKDSAPSRAQRLARQGDLFYQVVRPYQKNNYLFEKSCDNYVFSTGYAQIRSQVDGYFLLSLFRNSRFGKSVLERCSGTSYPAINSNDLKEITAHIPDEVGEQARIGEFFKNLDSQISLKQKEFEKLKSIRKSMQERMFV